MPPFKEQTFQERTALAAKARQAALEKLRAKPPIDEAVLAERLAAAEAKEAAKLAASAEKKAAREREIAEKKARAEAAAAEAEAAAAEAAAAEAAEREKKKKPKLSDEEKKAARDARYAARKNRRK